MPSLNTMDRCMTPQGQATASSRGKCSVRRRPALAIELSLGLACMLAFRSSSSPSFVPARPARQLAEEPDTSRRQMLASLGVLSALPAGPALALEEYTDQQLGISFRHPLGLQKSQYKGYNVFLRDILQPMEYIGVKVIDTQRKSLDDVGTPEEVGKKLVADLVPAKAPQEIIKAASFKDQSGRRNDIIEYAYQWVFDDATAKMTGRNKFQAHCKALVTIKNGKEYRVIIGSEEDRWEKRREDYGPAIDTFVIP
eukprot:TRINITY_DN4961_c0_g1_i1.p1 TRINITY_DN4961_c0_g1~~TRINITY_DN4961_c0_g1_i1.p1  ORF type:complete len:254 (+),score=45.44 TRINITY_DN4961_c0_g1_i1:32-793(+)